MIKNKNMFAEIRDRLNNDVLYLVNSGAPTSGSGGTGSDVGAGPGSFLIDITNNHLYFNIGTASVPIWLALNNGIAINTRTRNTAAEVNAGATLVFGIPGYKYRLIDAYLIAEGGAATTATTVDILGTQSSSSVKLLAAAVAGLTQNTLLRAGDTNATILAAGASFAANDAATAITIGKTGGSLAGATHIISNITYTIEKG